MSKTDGKNIMRHSHLRVLDRAVVGSTVPAGASPVSKLLLSLWSERDRLHKAQEAAGDVVGAQPGGENDDRAFARAIDALWHHDDLIMAAPASSIQDLAVKALVLKDRLPGDGDNAYEGYAHQLVADIVTLAAR
jgi:hypothetical protein